MPQQQLDLAPVTTLSTETIEELQPPCQANRKSRNFPPCEQPAEWITELQCEKCGHVYRGCLHCEFHKTWFQTGYAHCWQGCGAQGKCVRMLSAERL